MMEIRLGDDMETGNTVDPPMLLLNQPHKAKYRRRPFWTGGLVVAWVLLALVVLLTHIAVSKVVPPIRNLPANVLSGFDDVLRFSALEKDGLAVSNYSSVAMGGCLTEFSSASTEVEIAAAKAAMTANGECVLGKVPSFVPGEKQTKTKVQLDGINAAFSSTLTLIQTVVTDKCLAAEGFNGTAQRLNEITDKTMELEPVMTPCIASWPLYCAIYHSGKALAEGASAASDQIEKLVNSEAVNKLTDNLSYLRLLHGLPYLLVLYMVFFTAFWYNSGGVCCCCAGGHCLGCLCCLTPSMLLWLTYFILSFAIVAVGFIIRHFAKETEMKGVGAGCTIAELVTHLEVQYTAFFDLVLKDLLAGLVLFDNAFKASLALCLIMGFYAICLCFCRPYHRETKSSRELRTHVSAKE